MYNKSIYSYILVFITVLSLSCEKEKEITTNNEIISEIDPADTILIINDSLNTIGIYADYGAANACVVAAEKMFQWMQFNTKRIYASDINGYNIADIDVFYFPGGESKPYMDSITETGKNYLRYMIKRGCGYIGTCAGAIFACEVQDWNNASYSKKQLGVCPAIAYGPNTEIFAYPEIGMCKTNIDNTIDFIKNLPDSAWILYYNGPFFEIGEDANVYTIGSFDITGGASIIACEYGLGRVFLTSPHPEWEEDDNRDGVSYFDNYDDQGSDWPLMKSATEWCIELIKQ